MAQTVRGVVIGDGDLPVAGVVVSLVDDKAKDVGRALTDDRGQYRLVAPRPATYRLRTLRIGFKPLLTEPIVLNAGDDVSRRLTVSTLPIFLDSIQAVGRNPCTVIAGDSSSLVAAVWDQARAALLATQLSLSTNLLYTTSTTFQRMLGARSQRVGRETREDRSGFAKQPWISLSADSLRRAGYVFTTRDSTRIYNAPDLSVLLSDAFVEDHCFRIAKGSDDRRLGIEFEPTPARRDISEIRGTLWLDRITNELIEMEHGYVNRISGEEEKIAGGNMAFTRLRNGTWTIASWSIRMPVPVVVPIRSASFSIVRYDTRFDSIKVTGAELVSAISTGNRRDTLWLRGVSSLPAIVAVEPEPVVAAQPTTLDTMVTKAASAPPPVDEFERRRRQGHGHFLTRADIEKRAATSTGGLLQGMPSLRIVTGSSGEWAYNASQRCQSMEPMTSSGEPIDTGTISRSTCTLFYRPSRDEARQGVTTRCFSKVYVDKALRNPGVPTPPFNLREIMPSEIQSLEYYSNPAEMPVEYRGLNSGCGVVIIHTRR